jgi:hypothetical protein
MMEADTMLAWQIAPYLAMVWLTVTLAYAGVFVNEWRRRHIGTSGRGDLPPAPVNVRLVDRNGRVYPVELVYTGRTEGIDRWVATSVVPLGPGEFTVAADEIPARCSVELRTLPSGR